MRIFYASDSTPNGAIESSIWRNNLYNSLVDLGHDVVEFKYDLAETFRRVDPASAENRAFIRTNRPRVSKVLLEQIETAHAAQPIDLLFTYFYDACVLPETIERIKDLGIRTVNWYCNGSYQLDLVREISPHYNWCLVPELFRMADYLAMGARPIYCQEAANPSVYHPVAVPQQYDVTFVGQAYGERPAYIRFLHDAGIDIRVWGPGWRTFSQARSHKDRQLQRWRKVFSPQIWGIVQRRLRASARPQSAATGAGEGLPVRFDLPPDLLGDPLSDSELVAMYSRSKINLGFSGCGDTHLTNQRIVQVRLRDFEVPMSGGFYMVEYMPELERFFDIGQEIVCYENPADLRDKIRHYLAHEDEREAIRLAGYQRCLRDHSWQKRLTAAFAEMGFDV